MERLLTMGTLPSFMLTVQHRSHPKIAEFSSRMFYGGQIVSTPDDAYLLSGEGHNGPVTDMEKEKYRTFVFPETQFTAVTAYQNQLVSFVVSMVLL